MEETSRDILLSLKDFFQQTLGENSIWASILFALVVFAIALCVGVALYWVAYFLITRTVKQISKTWKNPIGHILIRRKVIKRACYFIVTVAFFKASPLIFSDFSAWQIFFHRLLSICNVYIFVLFIISLIWSIAEYQARKGHAKMRPIKGLMQFVTLAVYSVGIIVILSLIFNKSPMVLIGSLSALSAVLMLIFKDTLLGLVAGFRLSSNDMVRIGDWITIQKYGADGNVTDITLTTVKVRNFDNTIVTIPAYTLVSEAVINWRGMQESGMRRIKRVLNIDITTIVRLNEKVLFGNNEQLSQFLEDTECDDDAETNIGFFRSYAEWYLWKRNDISKDATLMVRQMDIDDMGVPLEIYCFATTTVWEEYERIQSEILEHLLSVVPCFGLSIYERSAQPDSRRCVIQS
ncbi:MAG: mechanosensitive ion channel family protein [Bacteroidales bacterium]|jgi:miniconductance mechanosensitive channel|nr:mechanosensitive ion channel family protein [Bacteroidales bacterium]